MPLPPADDPAWEELHRSEEELRLQYPDWPEAYDHLRVKFLPESSPSTRWVTFMRIGRNFRRAIARKWRS